MKGRLLAALVAFSFQCAFGADVAELIKKGDALDQGLRNAEALQVFLEAEKTNPADAELLYRIAKQYGLAINEVSSRGERIAMAEKALAYAKRAVVADPKNAFAHLAVAISYGRLAPFLDNRTKLSYSKLVKEEAEKTLALDPANDLGYHVLGAWNFELANLNPVTRSFASVLYGNVPSASHKAAVDYFKKAVALNSDRVANHVELGRALAAAGDKAEARKELQKSLDLPSREKEDPSAKERARAVLASL